MNSITFGELIKKRRVEKKMTIKEVAESIQFDATLLSKIERNKITAPPSLVQPLSQSLDFDYKTLQIKYVSDCLYKEVKSVDFSLEALEIVKKRIEQEQSGTTHELEKQQLIKKIKAYIKTSPIEKAWLFGSFARNTESLDSDIDLLIRFVKSSKIDLFEYIGIRQDLEDLTGRQVDLVEESQVLEKIKPFINRDKQLIYERKAL